MSAAVKYLTPVALELGGKCPAVLDSLSCSFDREVNIKQIDNLSFHKMSDLSVKHIWLFSVH